MCTPLFLLVFGQTSYQVFKKGSLTRSQCILGVCWEGERRPFSGGGGCSFYIKRGSLGRFKRGLGEIEGVVFLLSGGSFVTPVHTISWEREK